MTEFKKVDDTKVAIIGLGYVGLPLAVEFGRHLDTVGFDIDPKRIADLRAGNDFTLETDAHELKAAKHLKFSTDLEALHDLFANGLEPPGGRTVRWEADPALERGDIVVEGPQRLVDGRADVALRGIYERLAHA